VGARETRVHGLALPPDRVVCHGTPAVRVPDPGRLSDSADHAPERASRVSRTTLARIVVGCVDLVSQEHE
jgi:hypothetical protein